MKKVFLTFLAVGLTGCAAQQAQMTNTAQPSPTAVNASAAGKTNGNLPAVASSHGGEVQQQSPHSQSTDSVKPVGSPSSTGNSRSPMERAIDTSEMDAAIEKAAAEFKDKPKEAAAKTALAEAYFVRATALTEAAQYRAALGDFRRGLKLDPENQEAKEMRDQIVSIFQSLNREPPKEGGEPAPLPFKKA